MSRVAIGRTIMLALLAAVTSLSGVGSVHAQSLGSFAEADARHDGRVTLQDFEAYERRRLLTAKGRLAQRFRALRQGEQAQRLEHRFRQLDRGAKGYLDAADWTAAPMEWPAGRGGAGTRRQGLSVGAGLADVDPGYAGYHRRIDPIPLIGFRSGLFFVDGATAGLVAAHGNDYRFSVVLAPQLMRLRAADSPQLTGITTRHWSIDGGVNLALRRPWGLTSLSALHDILDRNDGTQIDARYGFPIPLAGGERLIPGIGLRWEDANLTRYYYGVTAAEALRSRPVYTPGAALNPSLRLDYVLPLSKQWQFGAGMGYTRFAHAIRDSPLIDQSGSLEVMVSLQYSLAPGTRPPAPGALTMPIEH